MTHIFLGIDSGLDGAVAALDQAGTFLDLADTPTISRLDAKKRERRGYALADIRTILQRLTSGINVTGVLATLEAVHAFPGTGLPCPACHRIPGQGAQSLFQQGDGFGMWKGMLAGLGIPFVLVPAQTWKRRFDLMGGGKDAPRLRGQMHWPTASLARKKDQGRADALHLAEYGRLTYPAAGTMPDRTDRQGDNHGCYAEPGSFDLL